METFKINMNEELSGVELTFSQKPDTRILTTLKDAGFRWHRVKKLWYAKRSETTLQVIAELKEGPSGTVIDNEPKPTDAGSEKENLDGVKIGDLYVASWGYEQTNLSFFQVVKISLRKSKKKVMQRGDLERSHSRPTVECLHRSVMRHSSRISYEETGKVRSTELSNLLDTRMPINITEADYMRAGMHDQLGS